jgi:hypothetical protein
MGFSSAEEINGAGKFTMVNCCSAIVVEKECKNFFGLQSCYTS